MLAKGQKNKVLYSHSKKATDVLSVQEMKI